MKIDFKGMWSAIIMHIGRKSLDAVTKLHFIQTELFLRITYFFVG